MNGGRSHGARRQRGVAAIEFSIILPLMMVLIAFTFYFGRMFWHYTVAHKAAHDAATIVAMARLAEIGAKKSDHGEIEISKLAYRVAMNEVAELNPGMGLPPLVEVRCDGYQCIGDKVPKEISVMVRMEMFNTFLPGYVNQVAGDDSFWFYAEVRMPYVGA